MNPRVREIPATLSFNTLQPLSVKAKKRVVAYARVSTDSDEQFTSFEAQVKYYEMRIADNPDWEYAGTYKDDGISGTSTKKRDGFNQMMDDAKAGKFDLILTKSISRFSRNTIDTLTCIEILKKEKVEVFFEKENIHTFDPQCELILTIMSTIAQEESRSISENVKWGVRAKFKNGGYNIVSKQFLGWKKDENGNVIVDANEAELVRTIYRMFLKEGKTPQMIAEALTAAGIKSPGGKDVWRKSTVDSILTNEKYKGDAVLQKTCIESFKTHKSIKNDGSLAKKYYVTNGHPGIIDEDEWNQTQIEFARRKALGYQYSARSEFMSKLVCGDCGCAYGRKKWHSGTPFEKYIYQCNDKFNKSHAACKTPNMDSETVKAKFLEAYNEVVGNKLDLKTETETMMGILTDTSKEELERDSIIARLGIIYKLNDDLEKKNKMSAEETDEYQTLSKEYHDEYDKKQGRLAEVNAEISRKEGLRVKLQLFIKNVESMQFLTEWSPETWNLMVEKAVVTREGTIEFHFFNGTTITK